MLKLHFDLKTDHIMAEQYMQILSFIIYIYNLKVFLLNECIIQIFTYIYFILFELVSILNNYIV